MWNKSTRMSTLPEPQGGNGDPHFPANLRITLYWGGPHSRANREISIFCIRLCFGIGYISMGLLWSHGIWEGHKCLNVVAMWGQRRLSVRLPLAPLALMLQPQKSHQRSAIGNAEHEVFEHDNMTCLGPRFAAALVLWQVWKLQQLTGLLWLCFLKTCSVRPLQVL